MIKIAMMLLKHQQINLKNGNTSNTEEINNTSSGENNNTPENTSSSSTPVEKTLATFSTKIYSKDSARQNNIKITCNSLNNTTVKNGSTFSFCNTVGQATSAKGYQKADIFDKDGNKKKGLGGGNCQVSTTLYNAVLKTPNMTVVERHEHSNKVPYISKGKDAAVAYGGYDLKFKNDTGFDIMIKTGGFPCKLQDLIIIKSFPVLQVPVPTPAVPAGRSSLTTKA